MRRGVALPRIRKLGPASRWCVRIEGRRGLQAWPATERAVVAASRIRRSYRSAAGRRRRQRPRPLRPRDPRVPAVTRPPMPRCRTPGSRRRRSAAGQGPPRTGAVPADRRGGRPGQVRRGQGARRGGQASPLDAVRIGHLDGDYYDPRCAWQRHRQIASRGAVLVRPDRFIAWRTPAGASDPRAVLAAALSQILTRPVGRVASPARPRPLSQQPPSGPLAGVPHHPPARPWRWPRPAP